MPDLGCVSENGQKRVLDFTHSFIRSVNQSQGGSYSMTGIEHNKYSPYSKVPILMKEAASQAVINQ